MIENSQSPLKEILIQEHGIVFFDKRPLKVPVIDTNLVRAIFQPHLQTQVLKSADAITHYLNCSPTGDQWGNDHPQRVKWRFRMNDLYGELFHEIYTLNNQFSGNNMEATRLHIELLSMYSESAGKMDFYHRFKRINRELINKFAGIDPSNGTPIDDPYNSIEEISRKLNVVHYFEDKSIEALQILSTA